MSILRRVRNAFDVPSRRRDVDYSRRVSAKCRYGILLLYRNYLREYHDDYWLPEVQGEMAHSHPPLAETQAWANDAFTRIAEYLQNERTPTSALLDFLELSLRHWRAPNTDNDFVDAVNRVLEEYDAPYLLTRYGFEEEPIQGGKGATYDKAVSFPRVYLKHDTVVQEQTIEPALEIFSDPAYETPGKDFRTALERQKNGDYDGCVTSCAAAVEGTLKVVAAKNKWKVKGIGLDTLAQSFINRSSLPDTMRTSFRPLSDWRNTKADAHGHASKDETTERIARHFVALSASLIVLVQADAK